MLRKIVNGTNRLSTFTEENDTQELNDILETEWGPRVDGAAYMDILDLLEESKD